MAPNLHEHLNTVDERNAINVKTKIITKIPLDENCRMLRIGFGKNNGKWFFRIDLWNVGFRFKKEYCVEPIN